MGASMVGLKAALYEHKSVSVADSMVHTDKNRDGVRARKVKRLNHDEIGRISDNDIGPRNRGVDGRGRKDEQARDLW